ncbi:hypothetical protein PBY51_015729 [Eleginops maclovinus]|uniref:Uncharacterized protein n=1 Tax=Eleginops maclovinus TaxID=56733 RepID=A0AAN8ARE7_ELEMC|nr:hypothetical protein PBY51_015729 [Eleginops maclovinus]
MEINSCGTPQHYRGMSPSEEPSGTSGQNRNLLPLSPKQRGKRKKDGSRSSTTGRSTADTYCHPTPRAD